jgi:translation initiation factor 1
MKDSKVVWSDTEGDTRNKRNLDNGGEVDEASLTLCLRRLTSGKGRTIIELSGLPTQKSWNKNLAKELKKTLGVGGSYKNDLIEIHGEKLDLVKDLLTRKKIKFKQIGG